MTPAFAAAVSKLPWAKIIAGIIIAALCAWTIWNVYSFISKARSDAELVETLQSEKDALIEANGRLVLEMDLQIGVLDESNRKTIDREAEHAKDVETILSEPPSFCARDSAPISRAVRLLHARNAPAPKAGQDVRSRAIAPANASGVAP